MIFLFYLITCGNTSLLGFLKVSHLWEETKTQNHMNIHNDFFKDKGVSYLSFSYPSSNPIHIFAASLQVAISEGGTLIVLIGPCCLGTFFNLPLCWYLGHQ